MGKLCGRHEATKSHQNSLLSADKFTNVSDGTEKGILGMMSQAHDTTVARNRQLLKCIIDTIILCGNQGLALRGHSEEDGNFMRLLQYRSKDNAILQEHLTLSKSNAKTQYTSPDIQNEIIDICGDMIVEDIVKACNKSPCFGFIADEATDCASIEQMALCVRFYDVDNQYIREDFIGFAECKSTTGEALTDGFLDNLTKKGVIIEKMRGQGYDGAANMSGKYRGVQARVKERVPEATYTHCKAHNLNLCIIHACKEPLVRNVMDTIQAIAFAFDYSAKRLLKFNDTLEEDELARNRMDNRRKLKTLCETRWASRADALFTFKSCFTTVHTALGALANEGDAKARSYQCSISKFDFIITLVATEHVLSGLVNLSALLQKKECDLFTATDEAKTVKRMLDAERNDPMVWDALFESASEIASLVDIEPSKPRLAPAQQHRPNVATEDVSSYWRINLYLPFVDHLMVEMDFRLLKAEPRYCAQHLLPSKVGQITDPDVEAIFDTYATDLNIEKVTFHREVQRWKVR